MGSKPQKEETVFIDIICIFWVSSLSVLFLYFLTFFVI
jgi:hypothetical protein